MILAPNVEFHEDVHEYYYKGRRLQGITGKINAFLGTAFSEEQAEFLEEYRKEGVHVHSSVQKYIQSGELSSVHPGAVWVKEYLDSKGIEFASEVLVTDFVWHASAIDIVGREKDGSLSIYDIKRTVKNRQYVTYQLSVYKYFIEHFTPYRVSSCTFLDFSRKFASRVRPYDASDVERILYGKN